MISLYCHVIHNNILEEGNGNKTLVKNLFDRIKFKYHCELSATSFEDDAVSSGLLNFFLFFDCMSARVCSMDLRSFLFSLGTATKKQEKALIGAFKKNKFFFQFLCTIKDDRVMFLTKSILLICLCDSCSIKSSLFSNKMVIFFLVITSWRNIRLSFTTSLLLLL